MADIITVRTQVITTGVPIHIRPIIIPTGPITIRDQLTIGMDRAISTTARVAELGFGINKFLLRNSMYGGPSEARAHHTFFVANWWIGLACMDNASGRVIFPGVDKEKVPVA
jgi:hypothetical protein